MKNLINTLIENNFFISGNKYEIIVDGVYIIFPDDEDEKYFWITYKTNKRANNGCPAIHKTQYKNLNSFVNILLSNNINIKIDSDLVVY